MLPVRKTNRPPGSPGRKGHTVFRKKIQTPKPAAVSGRKVVGDFTTVDLLDGLKTRKKVNVTGAVATLVVACRKASFAEVPLDDGRTALVRDGFTAAFQTGDGAHLPALAGTVPLTTTQWWPESGLSTRVVVGSSRLVAELGLAPIDEVGPGYALGLVKQAGDARREADEAALLAHVLVGAAVEAVAV